MRSRWEIVNRAELAVNSFDLSVDKERPITVCDAKHDGAGVASRKRVAMRNKSNIGHCYREKSEKEGGVGSTCEGDDPTPGE